MPLPRRITPASPLGDRPLVSVCLTHFNRTVYLRWALESLRRQDQCWPFEVILVDDGSTTEEARAYLERLEPEFHERHWRIVRQENRYLGAARNAAARHSRGKYLLFMDDDNYADPDEISTLAAIAERTGADILTCAVRFWSGNESPDETSVAAQLQWVPMGAAIESGFFWNAFGDANALVKREVFETLGGFVELHGTTCEDWEFFARAVFSGFDLQVVPLPLFWYRLHPHSMMHVTDAAANRALAIRPYLERSPRSLRNILLLSLAQKLELDKLKNAGTQDPETADRSPKFAEAAVIQAEAYGSSEREPVFRQLRRFVSRLKHRKIWKRHGMEINRILTSPFFNRHWYLFVYPDVAKAGMDPALHYFLYGGKEGRHPGPFFDGGFYLQRHPDVAASGKNALLHYIEAGHVEKREIRGVSKFW